MKYDPNYGEHAFADAEVSRDLQWLEDMARYDAEEAEAEEAIEAEREFEAKKDRS